MRERLQRSQATCAASRSLVSAASCPSRSSRSRRASSSSDSSSCSSKSGWSLTFCARVRPEDEGRPPRAPTSSRSTKMRAPVGRILTILPDCTCWYCIMLVAGSNTARQTLSSLLPAWPLLLEASPSRVPSLKGPDPLMGSHSSPCASLQARKPPATRMSSGSLGSGRPARRLPLISAQFPARRVMSSSPMCAASQFPSVDRANSK
mmetsp:Transcript_54335/g.158623  ORF Transcript_54335/g.158623 Transcript_54335/m.158623 type:complete len:206 (+) Transcript_54335:84-701(+)